MQILNRDGSPYSMDPVLKNLWIEALRSSKYLQGRDSLLYIPETNSQEQYCCLGVQAVLTDVPKSEIESKGIFTRRDSSLVIDGPGITFEDLPDGVEKYGDNILAFYNAIVTFPHSAEKFTLPSIFVSLNDGDISCNLGLMHLTDKHKFTFDEIADFIEKYL